MTYANANERELYLQRIEAPRQPDEVSYTLANLALSEARGMVMRAEEPSDCLLDSIKYRFDIAAINNESSDLLVSKRAMMLGSFLKPLIWSELLNIDGLTAAQAKNAHNVLNVGSSNDVLAGICKEALLEMGKIIKGKGLKNLNDGEFTRYGEIKGFLQEATPILLGGRTDSVELLALPTPQYEDALMPDRTRRADGILYDNRKVETRHRRYSYQVRSSTYHRHSVSKIPVIDGNMLGNNINREIWGQSAKSFGTLRKLIHERLNGELSSNTSDTLDAIWLNVRTEIMS